MEMGALTRVCEGIAGSKRRKKTRRVSSHIRGKKYSWFASQRYGLHASTFITRSETCVSRFIVKYRAVDGF